MRKCSARHSTTGDTRRDTHRARKCGLRDVEEWNGTKSSVLASSLPAFLGVARSAACARVFIALLVITDIPNVALIINGYIDFTKRVGERNVGIVAMPAVAKSDRQTQYVAAERSSRDQVKTERRTARARKIYPAVINSYSPERRVGTRCNDSLVRTRNHPGTLGLRSMNFSERCPIPSCVLYEIRPWHTRFFSSVLPPGLGVFCRSVSVTRDSRLLGEPKLILIGIFMALGQRWSRREPPVRLESH